MEITITSRTDAVSDAIRRHTEEKLLRLERFEKRPTHVQVFLNTEGGDKKVEMKVVVAGGGQHVAQATATSFRTALDQSLERLVRQLKRERERVRDHQAPKIEL